MTDVLLPSPIRPPDTRRRVALPASILVWALSLGGCVGDGGTRTAPTDGRDVPDTSTLQRVANTVRPGSNTSVRVVDGVVYVTGNVETAIDENAIVRALERVDGVERVESQLRRGM